MTHPQRPHVILGYSGLDGSAEFKAAHFSGLDPRESRLFQGLDSAAALVVNGEVVAAVQQERYSGIKFDHAFPKDAIDSCLRLGGVTMDDVDAVTHNFDYGSLELFSRGDPTTARRYSEIYRPDQQTALLHRHFPSLTDGVRVRPVKHHVAHALSAAIPSGYDRALVVVLDGMGELQAISVFKWEGRRLHRLVQLDYRSSLGLFYAAVTMHLGFWPNSDEYKVMAMAASGDPDRFAPLAQRAVTLVGHGRVEVPVLSENRDMRARETFSGTRNWFTANGCPPRTDEPLGQIHLDLAAAAQHRTEQAVIHIVEHWVRQTGIDQVALAGGVALNCVAIGELASSGIVRELYVQPAAGDEGTAVGAALSLVDPAAIAQYPSMTFLGPDVTESMPPRRQPFWQRTVSDDQAERVVGSLLARGIIVGWAQGRLEFGPRALGHRSILADPRRRDMRERVNSMVKFREGFRPLAPMVTAEHADQYFHLPPAELRHMTVATRARQAMANRIPAVVHEDGTARIQVVHQQDLPRIWRILNHFTHLTGVPVLMNTSLNVKGQPTARDGSQAFYTFQASELEVLVVDDQIYAKPQVVGIVEKLLSTGGAAGEVSTDDQFGAGVREVSV